MRILSPVPGGSGVEVLHRALAENLDDYRLRVYSPWWSLFPPSLPLFSRPGADLVHASADYGYLFARPGVPLVATIHNYTSDLAMRPFSSPLQSLHYRTDLRWFSRRTLQRAAVVVAISRYIGDLATRDLGVTPRMRVIYNGVDHDSFTPAPRLQRGRVFKVLFCGNLNRRKRAQLLPQLAAALDNRFEIHYTAGLSNDSLAGQPASGDGARLCALGRVSHADMPSVYQAMDALFMPSVREGFGLCVAEAMACGLPIVACRESAIPELVDDGSGGMLCAVDDVACYANAIRRLAEDRAAARRMGEFNRSRVEQQFTQTRMIDEYRALFEAVLDGAFTR